jgi:hypothetical protein
VQFEIPDEAGQRHHVKSHERRGRVLVCEAVAAKQRLHETIILQQEPTAVGGTGCDWRLQQVEIMFGELMYLGRHPLYTDMKMHMDRDRHPERGMPPLRLERLFHTRYELLLWRFGVQPLLGLCVQLQVDLGAFLLAVAIRKQLRPRRTGESASA